MYISLFKFKLNLIKIKTLSLKILLKHCKLEQGLQNRCTYGPTTYYNNDNNNNNNNNHNVLCGCKYDLNEGMLGGVESEWFDCFGIDGERW